MSTHLSSHLPIYPFSIHLSITHPLPSTYHIPPLSTHLSSPITHHLPHLPFPFIHHPSIYPSSLYYLSAHLSSHYSVIIYPSTHYHSSIHHSPINHHPSIFHPSTHHLSFPEYQLATEWYFIFWFILYSLWMSQSIKADMCPCMSFFLSGCCFMGFGDTGRNRTCFGSRI